VVIIKFITDAIKVDAANIGFDDEFIYKEIPLPYAEPNLPSEQLAQEITLEPF
jgi:guanine deaminase